MSVARAHGADQEVGCVLGCSVGVVLVLTDDGPVRASYGARLLGLVARDRSAAPEPGEWVGLRRWADGPVTVEGVLAPEPIRPAGPTSTLARVVPLRPAD